MNHLDELALGAIGFEERDGCVDVWILRDADGAETLSRDQAVELVVWLQRFLHLPVIVERPREFGVFASDSPPAKLAAAVVEQLREDLVGPVPQFRLSTCMVEPSVSLDADTPDEVRLSIELRGYWNGGSAVRT